ncbi:hypothetical protein AB0N07_45915 [Streptomyces sp. NPDC051172]|uniref:hypothetical protein n=1 Tax=Streptomyces sp. NPDC051172 TaxID=3155796 RepID=UPI00343BF3F1
MGGRAHRSEELDDCTVDYATFRENNDHTPLLKGLPEDRCQCPHTAPGTEALQFGPTLEVRPTSEAIMKNLQATQKASG